MSLANYALFQKFIIFVYKSGCKKFNKLFNKYVVSSNQIDWKKQRGLPTHILRSNSFVNKTNPRLAISNDYNQKSRPTTALQRVMGKLTGISFSPNPFLGFPSSSNGPKEPEPTVQTILALHLHTKLAKIIKIETKLIALQRELSEDLSSWAANIKRPGCQLMIRQLSALYVSQSGFHQTMLERLDKIKLSLHSVNEREKKHKDLVYMRSKLMRQVRDSEVRFGKNSSHTTLLSEKIEENSMNIEVLNTHCIRAIATEMKETVIDYTISLQQNLKFLISNVADFKLLLLAIDWEADMDISSKWVQISRRSVLATPLARTPGETEKENRGGDYVVEMERERKAEAKTRSDSSACKICKGNGRLITPCSHEGIDFVRPDEIPQEQW